MRPGTGARLRTVVSSMDKDALVWRAPSSRMLLTRSRTILIAMSRLTKNSAMNWDTASSNASLPPEASSPKRSICSACCSLTYGEPKRMRALRSCRDTRSTARTSAARSRVSGWNAPRTPLVVTRATWSRGPTCSRTKRVASRFAADRRLAPRWRSSKTRTIVRPAAPAEAEGSGGGRVAAAVAGRPGAAAGREAVPAAKCEIAWGRASSRISKSSRRRSRTGTPSFPVTTTSIWTSSAAAGNVGTGAPPARGGTWSTAGVG